MAPLPLQNVAGAILAVCAGGALVALLAHVYLEIRRTPKELLQLRLFQMVEALGRGLLALAIGFAGGTLLMLPTILQMDLPGALYVAAGLPFFAVFLYGLASVYRVFRIPAVPKR